MATPEGNRPGPRAMRAFDEVPRNHRFRSTAGFTDEVKAQFPTIVDEYLQGALGYFAGHTDPYLRGLGRLGREILTSKVRHPKCSVEFRVAPTFVEGMGSVGFPQATAESLGERKAAVVGLNDPKHVIFVVSYDFFIDANSPDKRIDLLGEFAFNLSHIQSILNDTLFAAPYIGARRASVTEAHFYNKVRQEPGVMLSERAQELVEQYPYGIYSKDIPPAARPPLFGNVN